MRDQHRVGAIRAPWRVSSAAFSSRSALLAVGGESLGVGLWDVPRGRWIWRKTEPVAGAVKSLQFSEDDQLLLSATQVLIAPDSADSNWFRSPRVWEVATGTQVATLARAIWPAGWTNDTRFVIGGGIGNAQVWERASGRQIAVLPHFDVSLARRELRIYGVGLSSNGARAYTAGQDGALAIWDVATQTEIHRIAAHKDTIMALAVTRDGRYALTGGRDNQGRLWDLQSFQEVSSGAGHRAAVAALAVSADGRELYSVSPDGRALAWALPAGQRVGEDVGWDLWPPSAALWGVPRNVSVGLARQGTIVVGSEGNHAFAVDRASGRTLWERDLTRNRFLNVGPGSDCLQAFSDFSPIIVDINTGETRFRLQTQQGGVLAISSNERLLAVADSVGALWLADAGTGAVVRRLAGHGPSQSLVTGIGTADLVNNPHGAAVSGAFRLDGALLVTSGWDKALRFWDVTTGAAMGAVSMPIAAFPPVVTFSPDGRWVVAVTGGELMLIDAHRFVLVGSLSLDQTPGLSGTTISTVTFSPDARIVYAGTARGGIVALSIAAAGR